MVRRDAARSSSRITATHGNAPRPIFLSYSRTDRASVETLYAKLNVESIPAWYDAGLQAGDVWKEKIRKCIANCSIFIPLVSIEALRRERAESVRSGGKPSIWTSNILAAPNLPSYPLS